MSQFVADRAIWAGFAGSYLLTHLDTAFPALSAT